MKNYRSYVILTVVIIIACFYRFFNIGSTNLWVDEYYHVFASKNILEGVGPLLPSGLKYMTALPYTLVVTLSRAVFGANNFAYRFPSALFGIFLIFAVFFLVKKAVNEKTALIVAVLIAFDPFSFWWSRISRMYSMFEFFFFISAFLLFILITDLSFDRKSIKLWVLFVLLFGLTLSLQPLGLILPVAAAAYVLAAYILKFKLNKRSIFLVVISALIVIMTITALYFSKSFAPSDYYLKVFYKLNPLFLIFVLTALGYSIWKKKSFGVFSGNLFFLALLIHSLFFPNWTHSRYILYSIPFAYIVLAIPLGDFADSLLKRESEITKNLVVVASIVLVIIFGKTMIAQSYEMNMTVFPDYKKAIAKIKKSGKKEIIISTLPVATSYYYGKTDYYLRSKNYNRYIFKKNGQVREIYTGAILINDNNKLKNIIKSNKDVWVFTDIRLYMYCSDGIRKTIYKYLKPVYVNKNFKIEVFRKN